MRDAPARATPRPIALLTSFVHLRPWDHGPGRGLKPVCSVTRSLLYAPMPWPTKLYCSTKLYCPAPVRRSWGYIVAVISIQRGIPSKRKSSACADYICRSLSPSRTVVSAPEDLLAFRWSPPWQQEADSGREHQV